MSSRLRFTPAQARQEDEWARQLHECRIAFVQHVSEALNTPSPTRRRELYQRWREMYGDDTARSYAKSAEFIRANQDRSLLTKFEKMIQSPPKPIPIEMIVEKKDG